MKIDFKEIEFGRTEYKFNVEPNKVDFNYPSAEFNNNVLAKFSTLASGDEIIVDGKVTTTVTAECHRCLRVTEIPLRTELKLVIQRTDSITDKDTGDDDFVIISRSEGQYDLISHCREALLIELPSKILCSEDCKGLCPSCGIDLNIEKCNCQAPKETGQWETLKNILEKK